MLARFSIDLIGQAPPRCTKLHLTVLAPPGSRFGTARPVIPLRCYQRINCRLRQSLLSPA